MRIGFTSIYSWRPHVEHMAYLAGLARDAGHETSYLSCDADLATCYAREARPDRSAWMHCTRCRAGGVRSFAASGVHSIGSLAEPSMAVPPLALEGARSSASTIGRYETDADFESAEFAALARRLEPAAAAAYTAARRWIERERLDAVCLFNGRRDATRGVLEAARDAGVRFVTMERTWFGDGIQLLPQENCLGLVSVDRMMTEWRDVPLDGRQARLAASHVASRFLRRNSKEWRAYNVAARTTDWPVANGRRRVLFAPGSRNEVWGHPDWQSHWADRTEAFDAVMARLNLSADDVVIRCHPNWAERIDGHDGLKAEQYYTAWARSRGIRVIPAADPTSTLGLIEQADAVVVCGGSAALEAGILGKQVIAVSPSVYRQAGFQSDGDTPQALRDLVLHADLDAPARTAQAARIARQTLRFAYTMVYRLPQYVPQVRCVTTTRYEYREGGDPQRLIDLLRTGRLVADDSVAATSPREEDEVLATIAARDWNRLLDAVPQVATGAQRAVRRRWIFRSIDTIRDALPRGDL